MSEETSEPTECPIPAAELPPAVQKSIAASSPPPMRMMAARGMAPMPPSELIVAQFALQWDTEPKIAAAAKKSMTELDPRLANAVLSDAKLNPRVLTELATLHATNEAYIEKLLLNPGLPSVAVVEIAKSCSERMISDHIVPNQARLLECPDIARSLAANPAALKSDLDRVIDFLVRSGKIVEGLKEFEEALLRLTGEDRVKAAQSISLPTNLIDERFLTEEERKTRELITEEEESSAEEDNLTIEQKIRMMTVAEKVAFATRGNKTVRTTLMRDTNRLVALAAITSPAITEQEVIAAAKSKSVHADVISHIIRDKKNNWVRNYQVKVALVNNPKTPLPNAMRLVPTLNGRDLKSVAKSKNVPAGVRTQATKLVKARR